MILYMVLIVIFCLYFAYAISKQNANKFQKTELYSRVLKHSNEYKAGNISKEHYKDLIIREVIDGLLYNQTLINKHERLCTNVNRYLDLIDEDKTLVNSSGWFIVHHYASAKELEVVLGDMHSGGAVYPINDVEGVGYWDGVNGRARMSLLLHFSAMFHDRVKKQEGLI